MGRVLEDHVVTDLSVLGQGALVVDIHRRTQRLPSISICFLLVSPLLVGVAALFLWVWPLLYDQ